MAAATIPMLAVMHNIDNRHGIIALHLVRPVGKPVLADTGAGRQCKQRQTHCDTGQQDTNAA